MSESLELIIADIEKRLYENEDYKKLFPNFKRTINYWIYRNAPQMGENQPKKAICLAMERMVFPLEFTYTNRLTNVLGSDYLEKINLWSKLDIVIKSEYKYKSKCECKVHSYSFNEKSGFAQWRSKIDDEDLKLRLMFGEPLISVFKTWRERVINKIENEYSEHFKTFSEAIQSELDSVFIKILK